MKKLLLAFAIFSSLPAYGAEISSILSIRSDKTAYTQGETAVLRASVATRPINTDFEFDVVGTLNGGPLPAERVTDFEFFSSAPNSEVGTYTWEATLVMQDKRYARDLKNSMAYFDGRIQSINEAIAEAAPEDIPALEQQKARYESLKAAAISELAAIRTPIQNLSLEFTVQ